MTVTLTILYPHNDNFNTDYYVKKHMPMLGDLWAPYGLKDYRITKFIANVDGSKPTYLIQTVIEFDSIQQIEKARTENGQALREDVPNFSKVAPTLIVGEEIGQLKM